MNSESDLEDGMMVDSGGCRLCGKPLPPRKPGAGRPRSKWIFEYERGLGDVGVGVLLIRW